MIEAIFILSKTGLLRFIKIYSEDESNLNRKDLVERLVSAIQKSRSTEIIFEFDYTKDEKRKICYKPFGGIYIAMIIDELENELAILDFIYVIMQTLDDIFKGISELHIIMNPEKMYLLFDEMISGGIVIETKKGEIIKNFNDKMINDENYKFFAS